MILSLNGLELQYTQMELSDIIPKLAVNTTFCVNPEYL